MSGKFDVIVIGAGPAGSRTASLVSARGYSVLLLEKRRRIGFPVRCAEAVGPAHTAGECFDTEGDYVSSVIDGVTIVSPSGRRFSLGMPGVGYVLDRERFDRHLAEEARRNGTDLRAGHQAMSLLREGPRVVGVRVKKIEDSREYDAFAAVTVGADGVESLSPRWAGLKKAYSAGEVLSCAQELVSGIDVSSRYMEFHLGSRIAPGGYAWVFPKSADSANVGVGIDARAGGGKNAFQYLESFLGTRCPEGKRCRLVAGGSVVARGLPRLSADGFVAVGEAANQNNPFTGGGILNALAGAHCAADAIVKALEASDTSALRLAEYTEKWGKTVGSENEKYFRIAQVFYRLSDMRMERILVSLASRPGLITKEGVDPSRIIGVIMRRDPGFALKALLPFAASPIFGRKRR